jgi:hypothetical protein
VFVQYYHTTKQKMDDSTSMYVVHAGYHDVFNLSLNWGVDRNSRPATAITCAESMTPELDGVAGAVDHAHSIAAHRTMLQVDQPSVEYPATFAS